jgi:hypothetical protein
MPHYLKTTEMPDYNPDRDHKKFAGRQRKRKKEKEIKYKKNKNPYSPKNKEVRGVRKKELFRKEKAAFPLGRPLYSIQDETPYRQVIYPKDVQSIMGLSPRGARSFIAKLRKEIGKKRGDVITITEFCDKTKIERNEVIKHLLN